MLCDYQCDEKRRLRKHEILNHNNDNVANKNILRCSQCKYETIETTKLDVHVRIVHEKDVRYKCDGCDYKSYWKLSVVSHIKRNHKYTEQRIIGIGCLLCASGENHDQCDFVRKNL